MSVVPYLAFVEIKKETGKNQALTKGDAQLPAGNAYLHSEEQ